MNASSNNMPKIKLYILAIATAHKTLQRYNKLFLVAQTTWLRLVQLMFSESIVQQTMALSQFATNIIPCESSTMCLAEWY